MFTPKYMAWILPSLLHVLFVTPKRSPRNCRFVSGLTSLGSYDGRTSRSQCGHPRLTRMALASAATTTNDLESVSSFVRSAKQRLLDAGTQCDASDTASVLPHLFIGNEAGDADSILSAIGLAYVRSLQNHVGDNNNNNSNNNISNNKKPIVPIVSIPSDSLKFLRPETTFLLMDCAGMSNVKDEVNDLIAIDQTDLLPAKATVTLVDHNVFRKINGDSWDWTVTEIMDHHLDEGQHADTCPLSNRNIAFEEAQALVASTTTLVAEDFYANNNNDNDSNNNDIDGASAMPPSLAILLLGTILLDSVNMSPKAGKGTPRDAAMIERLLAETDWSKLALPEEIVAVDSDGTLGTVPDPTKLFEHLQNAKFSPDFWSGLNAEQAIRMDFKSFSVPGEKPSSGQASSSSSSSIGIASILLEMNYFFDLQGDTLPDTVARVMEEDQSEMLGLMCSTFSPTRRRQLALASYDKPTLDRLVDHLTTEGTTTPELEMKVLQREAAKASGRNDVLYIVRMEQGNLKASRKQVAPILLDFFKKDRES